MNDEALLNGKPYAYPTTSSWRRRQRAVSPLRLKALTGGGLEGDSRAISPTMTSRSMARTELWSPDTSETLRTSSCISPRRIGPLERPHRFTARDSALVHVDAGTAARMLRSRGSAMSATATFRSLFPHDPPPVPEVMRFFTAWKENGAPRSMELRFWPATHDCVVQSDVPLAVSVTARNGAPIEAWDLHVGARLTILGRPVVLKKASQETQAWLDYQAKRLLKSVLGLESELAKFCFVSRTKVGHAERPHHAAWGNFLLPLNPHVPGGGTLSLRGLLLEIAVLKGFLAQYRPSQAAAGGQSSEEPSPTATAV